MIRPETMSCIGSDACFSRLGINPIFIMSVPELPEHALLKNTIKPGDHLLNETLYLIEGDVLSHHAAQAVDERGEGDSPRCIAVPPHLCARPGEVKHCAALRG